MKIENLCFSYDDKLILDNLSFDFDKKITAITGASGRGKTTLLRILAGIETNFSGLLEEKTSSYLYQENLMLKGKNVINQIKCFVSHDFDCKSMLDLVNLENVEQSKVNSLSGGMQRRLCLARALAFALDKKKQILILDEPFSSVDEKTSIEIFNKIKKFNIPTILSSHQSFITNLCDEVFEL